MTERVLPDGTVVDGLGNFKGIDQPAAAKLFRGHDRLVHYGSPHGPVVVSTSDVERLDKIAAKREP